MAAKKGPDARKIVGDFVGLLFAFCVIVVGGLMLAGGGDAVIRYSGQIGAWTALSVLGLLGGMVVGTTIHEFGHWVAAKLLGFEVRSFCVHHVCLQFREGRLRRVTNPRANSSYVLAVPIHCRDLKWRCALLSAAGPLADLAWGISVLLLPIPTFAKALLVAVPAMHLISAWDVRHTDGQDLHEVKSAFDRDPEKNGAARLAVHCRDPKERDQFLRELGAEGLAELCILMYGEVKTESEMRGHLEKMKEHYEPQIDCLSASRRSIIAYHALRRGRDVEWGKRVIPEHDSSKGSFYWRYAKVLLALHEGTESDLLPDLRAWATDEVSGDAAPWFGMAVKSFERRVALAQK